MRTKGLDIPRQTMKWLCRHMLRKGGGDQRLDGVVERLKDQRMEEEER